MEKVIEKGPAFIREEQKRLEKVKKSKVSSDKKREFTVRLNVLTAFL
jgi:Endoplasmic reticulum protein ERp29, C-terminal domain